MRIRLAPENFKRKETAHAYLKEIFHFPDHYGENLDALHDCLCELVVKTIVTVPRVIAAEDYLGAYGETMLAVFRDADKENENLQVHFE